MNALKTPSFFRPSSRPSSPAPTAPTSRPDSAAALERSRPLQKLSSLSTFRRPSPSPVTVVPALIPLVQDGSYLEMLSLKLSEAISKALAQPTGTTANPDQLAGKRPIPIGRGHALGALIASELTAAKDNPHLYRAIIRSLHRPLPVLLTSLSSMTAPLLSSPAFVHIPTVHASSFNATQAHALGVSGLAGELLETFDTCSLGYDGDPRGDGLKSIREGLVSLVTRVVTPLINGIKADLLGLVETLEHPSSGTIITPKSAGAKPILVHSTFATLQQVVPIYGRILLLIATASDSQPILATFLISLAWHSLLSLSSRPYVQGTPPSSPGLGPVRKRRGSPSTTPPLTPPPRFTIKLPSSRPPSPQHHVVDTLAADARTLYELFSTLPRPRSGSQASQLAGEAVDEAFEALRSLSPLIEAARSLPGKANDREDKPSLVKELEVLTKEMPTLVALPILLHAYDAGASTVPKLLDLSDEEYRNACLSGFGRADECAVVVGQRILEYLHSDLPTGRIVSQWLIEEIEDAVLT